MSDQIIGRNPVLEALRSGRSIHKLLVAQGAAKGSILGILGLARDRRIQIQEVTRQHLDTMTDSANHQGVVALAAAKAYVEVEDILRLARERNEEPFILILDEIEDPHNLGAILRTADAAGVHGVIIPKHRAVGLTSAVTKASAGAVEYIPVARVTNLVKTIEKLKEAGCWIAGSDATAQQMAWDADLKGSVGLIIGSEGKGISRLLREKCDYLVKYPMRGEISSLNASVAAALICYEVVRQRGLSAKIRLQEQ